MEGYCFSPVEKPLGIKLLIPLHHHLTPSFISDPMRAITTTQATAYFLVLKKIFFFFKSFVCRQGTGKTSYITSRQNQKEYTHTCLQTEPWRSEDAPHADGERAGRGRWSSALPSFSLSVLPKLLLCMLTAKQVKDFASS